MAGAVEMKTALKDGANVCSEGGERSTQGRPRWGKAAEFSLCGAAGQEGVNAKILEELWYQDRERRN